jgi:C4-dicarboxylate transporter DctM subunit
VGLNLFFASYRFDKPLLTIYRAAVPMLLILGLGVLVITYVPWLTTFLLGFSK